MRIINDRSGKIQLGFLLLVLVVAAGAYYGREFGTVYVRKWKFEDAVKQHISFAGQLTDEAIRQKVLDEAVSLRLPPQARNVRLTRSQRPRAIRISITYSESVDLLFKTQRLPFTIDISRGF